MAAVGCLVVAIGSVFVEGQLGVDGTPSLLVPPVQFVTDITVSEDTLTVVQERVNATLLDGVRAFDWGKVAEGLSEDFRGTFPAPDQGRAVKDHRLVIRQYSPDDLGSLDRDEFLNVLRAYTSSWTSVERASWKVSEFLLEPTLDRAFLKVHLQLGGPDSTGARSVLDATITVHVRKVTPGGWTVAGVEFIDGTTVYKPSPQFRDITDAVGFHFNRSDVNNNLRQDIVDTRSSLIDSSLSVVDWNHDGLWDVIATESMNQSLLFLNDGKGGFVRAELPFDDPRLIPAQVLFVDLDGDGLEELVGNRVLYHDGVGSIGLHTRRDGEWAFLPNALEFDNPLDVRRADAQPMTVGDVNGDGLLDLFIGGYETDQSRDPQQFNRVDAQDGADNLLFINHGELQFTEESDARGVSGMGYTYVVGLFDFDGDGDLDLFEGNDYGRNVLRENDGDGVFHPLTDHPLASNANNTMGLTIGDWDNSGSWSVYLSNMYSHAGHRVVRLTQSLGEEMRNRLQRLTGGNQLFMSAPDTGSFVDRAVAMKVNAAGWAWASLFVDLDNDGDKELFVSNGNTSHRDPNAPDY